MRHKPNSLVRFIGRRKFLAGAAGILSLPFLESLTVGTKVAHAWTPAPGMPQRLAIFFHGHGSIMEEFIPRDGFQMAPILQPVADLNLSEKLLVLGGVNSKVQGGHPGTPSLLSCVPTEANQFGVTHSTGVSIDQIIARHMQDGGPARRLDIGVHADSTNPNSNGITQQGERTFWAGDDELLDTYIKPQNVYDRVFPNGTDPEEQAADTTLIRRRSVLDGVLKQFTALEGRVSAGDKARLDRHATHVREFEKALENYEPPTIPMTCSDGLELDFENISYQRAAELQVDILSHAIACNYADVGTFKMFDLPEQALAHIIHPDMVQTFAGEGYHGAWHRASDQNQDYARRAFTAINRWYGELFARLLRNLNDIDEGNGTALDNTMVLWASDFGHGGGHSSDNLHLAFAGNAGNVPMGRFVDYCAPYNRNAAANYGDENQPGNHNLAVTMQQAFGIESDTFGDYTSVRQPVSPGPLDLS